MTDLLSIVENGNRKYSLFNIAVFIVSVLSAVALSFFGVQTNNIGYIFLGTTFTLLAYLIYSSKEISVLTSSSNPVQASLAYWIPQIVLLSMGFFGSYQFSLYSLPSQGGYLSSILAGASPTVQNIVNFHFAPFIENLAIIGLMGVIYIALRSETDLSPTSNLWIVSILGGVIFGSLHGTRSVLFFISAFLVMFIIVYLSLGEDTKQIDTLLPVTLGFGIGIHRAINIGQSEGLIKYYQVLLQAEPPISFISYLIITFDIVTFTIAVYGLYKVFTDKTFRKNFF